MINRDTSIFNQFEKTYKKLIENSHHGFALFHEERAQLFNKAFINIISKKQTYKKEIVLKDLIEVIYPEDRPLFVRNVMERNKDKKYSSLEIRVVNKRGKIIWFDLDTYYFDFSGKSALQLSFFDFTNKKSDERKLVQANLNLEKAATLVENQKALQKLTRKLVKTQEEARRNISRELHDETGQALMQLKYYVNSIVSEFNPNTTLPLSKRINECSEIIDSLIFQTRSLSHKLRPPSLDPGGINVALSEYCQEFAQTSGLEIVYKGKNLEGIPEETSINIYRILQEALSNIKKHAQAKKVYVTFGLKNKLITLLIKDDGIGYDPRTPTNGIGVLGMKERIAQLSGKVKIKTKPGKGTCIKIYIPFGKI